MAARSALMNVMIKAAEKAAKGLKRDFGEVEHLQISRKGPADFVSAADIKAQQVLREELGQARPDFGFLMEESDGATDTSGKKERWIVDPLDGTTNFLHGVPHWAISIGAERDGEMIAGLVYDPIKDESFWAEKGLGAWMNNKRMRVSARGDLAESLIATGIPFKGAMKEKPKFMECLNAVMPQVAGIRRFGAAALDLAYVAAGRYEAYWENGISIWDIAAGLLLVKEAGGFVVAFDPKAKPLTAPDIIATNAAIHDPLVRLLRDA
ncbi:MAG: inositol monophosphatase family protein [Alphaproteobacteria bacterium]|nr:inositol monophosphatase family protein [Alphaproteobacteria bacterium]